MAFTFGEIKKIVAPYAGRAGKCAGDKDTADFAREVMQYLLLEGSDAAIRKVSIQAYNGFISLPPEVETPLKVKVEKKASHIRDKWCSYHPVRENCDGFPLAEDVLEEDGTSTPLAYELPMTGSIIGIEGHCDEGCNASVIIQGKDTTRREVFTFHKGEQVPGEKLSIEKDVLKHGQVVFGSVTGVLKTQTNMYVSCFAYNPLLGTRQFLADWGPNETKPLYRRYRLLLRNCPSIVHISMLCRVKLKDNYHDNELTFFENNLALILGAQRIQSEKNDDVQTANYKRTAVADALDKEAGYRKQSGKPLDVFLPTSGGSIKNII